MKEIKYILIRKKDVKERIRQLKINWQCPGSMKPSMTQSSSGGIRDTSNYSTALEELEEELKKLNEELSQAEAVRIRAINELPHKYASILEKRYIYRKEFEEIGKEIGYEKSNVYELHRKALDMFQIPK